MKPSQKKEKMKVEFEITKKESEIEGKKIQYYVLKRTLINGETIEVTLKGDKAKLLLMSLYVEETEK